MWDHRNMPRWQRPCDCSTRFAVFLATSFGGRWPAERSKWPDRAPCVCVCTASSLHGRQVHLPASCELPTIGGLLRSPWTSHEDSARQQVWCMPMAWRQWHDDKLCRPVAANPCRPCVSRCLPHHGVRFSHHNTHPTLACLFVVRALLIAFDNTSSRSQPMPCKSCTASYHNTSQHIPHYPHSQELFQCLFPFASPSLFPISQITRASSHMFCLGFFWMCFLFFVFLTFFSFSRIFGYFWFCAFWFVVPYFANFWIVCIFENFLLWLVFWIFSPFSEKFSFWLLFVLSCQQVRQELNLRPKLAAPRLLSSPTHVPATTHTSPHNTTLPLPTQPHPANSAPHLSHPPPHTHPRWKFSQPLFPNIPLRVCADTREGVCLTGVGIPNLGALPIIASFSRTHLPCLFACFYESVSCVYAVFSTCFASCVASAEWFMFGFVFITTFLFSCFFSCEYNTYLWHGVLLYE